MHLPFLSESQRENVRPIEGRFVSKRSISIYLRADFIRLNMLKSVIHALQAVIPQKMINPELSQLLTT